MTAFFDLYWEQMLEADLMRPCQAPRVQSVFWWAKTSFALKRLHKFFVERLYNYDWV